MQYDGEDIQKAIDPMTEEGRLREQVEKLRQIRLKLEAELKASRADAERARKLHGQASTTAYRLSQENDALLVTIRVLSKELEQWKQ